MTTSSFGLPTLLRSSHVLPATTIPPMATASTHLLYPLTAFTQHSLAYERTALSDSKDGVAYWRSTGESRSPSTAPPVPPPAWPNRLSLHALSIRQERSVFRSVVSGSLHTLGESNGSLIDGAEYAGVAESNQ